MAVSGDCTQTIWNRQVRDGFPHVDRLCRPPQVAQRLGEQMTSLEVETRRQRSACQTLGDGRGPQRPRTSGRGTQLRWVPMIADVHAPERDAELVSGISCRDAVHRVGEADEPGVHTTR